MVAVPAATPVTVPLVLFTVAVAVALLLHSPPLTPLVKVVLLPAQTAPAPEMGLRRT